MPVDPNRGGAPVGLLADLGPVEAGAVLTLRLWCDGPQGRNRIADDFATALGPDRGNSATRAFGDLIDAVTTFGRRPLMRHHLSCACLGADESCFANFVACATEGCREDAMLIATLLVRPDVCPVLVAVAQDFGLALKCIALAAETHRPTAPPRSHLLH